MRISRSVLATIGEELKTAYPSEGCGLLVGAWGADGDVFVQSALRLENRRAQEPAARNRYLIAPEDFRAAERQAAESGLEIVGVYHSHPDVAARPSKYDEEHAWPSFRYLILSVAAGNVREERVWELTDDRRFVERTLKIEEP